MDTLPWPGLSISSLSQVNKDRLHVTVEASHGLMARSLFPISVYPAAEVTQSFALGASDERTAVLSIVQGPSLMNEWESFFAMLKMTRKHKGHLSTRPVSLPFSPFALLLRPALVRRAMASLCFAAGQPVRACCNVCKDSIAASKPAALCRRAWPGPHCSTSSRIGP